MSFTTADYGPIFSPLLAGAQLNELGPGHPDQSALAKLKAVSLDEALAPAKIADRGMAEACLAGLYLMYDGFEESHTISQSIETPSGSYWHGILHRREPDYGNAKYWFRRVGRHPVFERLVGAARELAASERLDRASAFLAEQRDWDPFHFVDLCEAAAEGKSTCAMLCRNVQQKECELLFDHCFRAAKAG
jgi:hypothetical protein